MRAITGTERLLNMIREEQSTIMEQISHLSRIFNNHPALVALTAKEAAAAAAIEPTTNGSGAVNGAFSADTSVADDSSSSMMVTDSTPEIASR